HIHDHGAQIHPHHLLHARNQQDEPRALDPVEAAQHEDHRPLVLADDAKGADQDRNQQGQRDRYHVAHESVSTCRVKPSTAIIRTCSPRRTGRLLRACQVSPWVRTRPMWSKSSNASALLPTMASMPVTTR